MMLLLARTAAIGPEAQFLHQQQHGLLLLRSLKIGRRHLMQKRQCWKFPLQERLQLQVQQAKALEEESQIWRQMMRLVVQL
jgi:hypothetical protein